MIMDSAFAVEKWADIPGWEGLYQISDLGRIKSFKTVPSGMIMSIVNNKGGYLSIVLCAKGRPMQSEKIHRLVAKAFLLNPENKPQVNHKDGDKQNNRASNLEWTTAHENRSHAMNYGLANITGMRAYNQRTRPKRLVKLSLGGKLLGIYFNAKLAGRINGICSRNILQVASKTEYKPGKIRTQAGGFIWMFKEDYERMKRDLYAARL